ncbi:unnamed protein product [Clonostachys rhizophaga]|uniref:Uncharacterized protein n=1 Tax=Clonostachys rhizophaga TaxID=160324 RepID=A0A9N9VKL5_9HYPO|nr:unnamed protein product [Clonostachys rhizophaga]
MCTTNVQTYRYADGRVETVRVPQLCPHSRHGIPCSGNVLITHPEQRAAYPGLSASVPSMSSQYLSTTPFPPTPPSYSPRSSTPNYRSGDESDMSGNRSGSSSRSNRHSTALFVDGQQVYNVEHGHGSRRRRSSSRRERYELGTPPSPQSGSSSQRPIVINQSGRIEVPEDRGHRHGRHSSTSSHGSHGSHGSYRSHDDEEREAQAARNRERRKREVEQAERQLKQKRPDFHNRVERANATIASRPAIPSPPRQSKHATPYHPDELVNSFSGLGIQEPSSGRKSRRRHEQEQAIEDELQEQRLRDRLSHRRTVSSGSSRRHRILYDDGSYRWE